MAAKKRQTRKKVVKSTAKRGAKSTARAVKRPVKRSISKSTAKRGMKAAARAVKRPVKRSISKSTAKRGMKAATRAIKQPVKKFVAKSITKQMEKPAARSRMKLDVRPVATTLLGIRPESRPVQEIVKKTMVRPVAVKLKTKANLRQTQSAIASAEARRALRMARMPQFTYMNPPGVEHAFEVGHTVEVFCDHERNSDRIRGWVKGIVVQVDNKLVAVQFRSNVYLTDGWMVPDHILWYPITSDQIRAETFAKKGSKKDIPEY